MTSLIPVMTSFIILLSTMYLQRVYMVTNNNAARVATHDVGHRGCAQRHRLVRRRYSAWWQRMLRLVLHTVSAMLGIDAAATALLRWRCCATSVLCRRCRQCGCFGFLSLLRNREWLLNVPKVGGADGFESQLFHPLEADRGCS
jgi:hypothetical protein